MTTTTELLDTMFAALAEAVAKQHALRLDAIADRMRLHEERVNKIAERVDDLEGAPVDEDAIKELIEERIDSAIESHCNDCDHISEREMQRDIEEALSSAFSEHEDDMHQDVKRIDDPTDAILLRIAATFAEACDMQLTKKDNADV